MNKRLLFCGLAAWTSVAASADFEADWYCLTNTISASVDLNPTNRTDAQRLALFSKRCRMVELSASELVATNREALFACLDDIGTYVLFPTNAYWNELEDAKAAFLDFQATNTYARTPGIIRRPWSPQIAGTGRFGVAVCQRWEHLLSRNEEIARYRQKVLAAFKPVVQTHLLSMPEDVRTAFKTNVVTRAALSEQEAETLFAQ